MGRVILLVIRKMDTVTIEVKLSERDIKDLGKREAY
jgi:hypothetical protein